jgi:hypothetical protein
MPARNLLLEHLIDHFMLLDHAQAVEPRALNLQRIHGATPAADILHLVRHHVSLRNLSSPPATRLIPQIPQHPHDVHALCSDRSTPSHHLIDAFAP